MFTKTLGAMAVATVVGFAGAASADDAAYQPYYPSGKFVDNPDKYGPYHQYAKPDECYFDFKPYFNYVPGKDVEFKKKVVKYYDYYEHKYVYYTLVKATCDIPTYYKAKKKLVLKGFPCSYEDNNYYPVADEVVYTYDSKFVIKKGAKQGDLTCKFKIEPDEHEPPVAEAPETPEEAPTEAPAAG